MSSDVAIAVRGASKCYAIYDKPHHRLLQSFFRHRRRFFKEFWALRDVDFEIRRGETVGIVGRNGSGKSTLLQILAGTLTPTAGEIVVNGRVSALLELGSGFNPEFTGRENVYLNASILGLSQKEIDQRFDSIAAFADIGEFMEQPVKTYSSGMYVRLAFAVAINVDPDILIVDEALSVGDEAFQRKCFSRIEQIRAAGGTILCVSHSAGLIVELCDRAMLLDGGELLLVAAPKPTVALYQRLLYAPPDSTQEVRAQIRNSGVGALTLVGPGRVDTDPQPVRKEREEAAYDPNLRPVSTMRFISRGALIEDPHIVAKSGQRVNILQRGARYRYCYTVRFANAASNVRMGLLIKTVTGFELAGAASAPFGQGITFVPAGSTYTAEFEFTCCFNAGTYFVNAGVVGIVGEEELYLDRILDAIMFRVEAEPRSLLTGIVDCTFAPRLALAGVGEPEVSSGIQHA